MAKARTTTTASDFKFFEKECRRHIKAWGITGWNVSFFHEQVDGCRAQIHTRPVERVASIRLSINLDLPVTKHELSYLARHEVVHLLVSPLADIVCKRYLSADEETAANESVCNHLEGLLP